MSGKQMEGDNQRRRALARLARNRGGTPSENAVTLGASKQAEHLSHADRAGPVPAGPHKPAPGEATIADRPPLPLTVPEGDPERLAGESAGGRPLRYRELVSEIGRRAGLPFEEARVATEATITALAQLIPPGERPRLLEVLPPKLRATPPDPDSDRPAMRPAGLVVAVGDATHRSLEQARYRAQAVLSVVAEHHRDVIESLRLPPEILALTEPPPIGGGVVGVDGRTPPLTDDEVRAALHRLPHWSGDARTLWRVIELLPADLDRVLQRVSAVRADAGRRPYIGRRGDRSAVLAVWTRSVDAVTALDIDTASRIDEIVASLGEART